MRLLIHGMKINYKFIRPHMDLDGKTPPENCGIKVEGDNKWLTLIQNAKGESCRSAVGRSVR